MAHSAHLYKVKSTYYFRVRIPKDLQPWFPEARHQAFTQDEGVDQREAVDYSLGRKDRGTLHDNTSRTAGRDNEGEGNKKAD